LAADLLALRAAGLDRRAEAPEAEGCGVDHVLPHRGRETGEVEARETMREIVEQGRVPIKIWEPEGFPTEHEALNQLRNVASLPVVGPHVAVMPDVHFGIGATVGSVIPTNHAIIPAAVGVDIGCGMMAVKTALTMNDVADKTKKIFDALENSIPVGGPGAKGSWNTQQGWWKIPTEIEAAWALEFEDDYADILFKHPLVGGRKQRGFSYEQLGTLGTGNHFIEVCYDTEGGIWFMLHSGSRGLGNRIGMYFIEKAREVALTLKRDLPDRDLAWLDEGTPLFEDYREAVTFAQRFAYRNRTLMMRRVFEAVARGLGREYVASEESGKILATAVNCHHNYVEERPGGVWLTRKGAVSARHGELGIIPGSMGAKSFIVRGKGNADSYESCSHGAGRTMSRGRAKREITLEQHQADLAGVECRKDASTLDEAVKAYKSIDAVMEAQIDLVDVVATLKQVVSVKG
jgi:tRNA-splicing ligase RtcB (3'-phosphate/5'-hydroxy nucleic acid ligase)